MLGLGILGGCHSSSQNEATSDKPSSHDSEASAFAESHAGGDDQSPEGVSLKPEEIKSLGIAVTPAAAMNHVPEAAGFGVVGTHVAVAQALMEIVTAQATERQSRAALDRMRRLAGTPGALPTDALENAERQAAVDRAATLLAQQKLTASFGEKPPWGDRVDSPTLRALASGEIKWVRVTFPLGLDDSAPPSSLRFAHLGDPKSANIFGTRSVWNAPADASIPGRSFFALLKGTNAREGERLLAWMSIGEALAGVWVPASAVVISENKYWCYVETKPGKFVRKELDVTVPVNQGYFLQEGIRAGDQVVTAAAGQLLARETNPASGGED
jgi:hypothetical protein